MNYTNRVLLVNFLSNIEVWRAVKQMQKHVVYEEGEHVEDFCQKLGCEDKIVLNSRVYK